MGATEVGNDELTSRGNFNSCIPGGMQLPSSIHEVILIEFQFMHPGWDATWDAPTPTYLLIFQFMHPVWDATIKNYFTYICNFNSCALRWAQL